MCIFKEDSIPEYCNASYPILSHLSPSHLVHQRKIFCCKCKENVCTILHIKDLTSMARKDIIFCCIYFVPISLKHYQKARSRQREVFLNSRFFQDQKSADIILLLDYCFVFFPFNPLLASVFYIHILYI